MSSLFEGHQLALQYLVPNLLQLYVDIEFTGAHNQVSVFFSFILAYSFLLQSERDCRGFCTCSFGLLSCGNAFYICLLCSFTTNLIFVTILRSYWSTCGVYLVITTLGSRCCCLVAFIPPFRKSLCYCTYSKVRLCHLDVLF